MSIHESGEGLKRVSNLRRHNSLIFSPYKVSDKVSDDSSEDSIKPLIAKNKDLASFKEIIKKAEKIEKNIEQNKQNIQNILENYSSKRKIKKMIKEINKQEGNEKQLQAIDERINNYKSEKSKVKNGLESSTREIDRLKKLKSSSEKLAGIEFLIKENENLEQFEPKVLILIKLQEFYIAQQSFDILESIGNNIKNFSKNHELPSPNMINLWSDLLGQKEKELKASSTEGYILAQDLYQKTTAILSRLKTLSSSPHVCNNLTANDRQKDEAKLYEFVSAHDTFVDYRIRLKETIEQDNTSIKDFDKNALNQVINESLSKEVKLLINQPVALLENQISLLESMKKVIEHEKNLTDLYRENKVAGKDLQKEINEHKEKLKNVVESRLDTIQDLRKRQRDIENTLVYAHDCVKNGKMDSIFDKLTDIALDAESRTAFFEEWWKTQWEELKQIKEQLEPSPYLAAETQALPQGWQDRQESWSDDNLKEIMKLDKE